MGEMPSVEQIAMKLAEHFALRGWDTMAANRRELKILFRASRDYTFDEPTQDDCLEAAKDILSLLSHREGQG